MHPTCAYLVCATPRSGSTLLCEALTNTGLAGRPKEYFEALKATGRPRQPNEYFTNLAYPELASILDDQSRLAWLPHPITNDYPVYLDHVLRAGTTPNGVFGAKMMWGYFGDFLAHLRDIPIYSQMHAPELLATIFPDLHYLLVTRLDKVRQAVSLWKAIQTWTWREDEIEDSPILPARSTGEPRFHFEAIDQLYQQIVAHERAWQEYFNSNGIRPYCVVYEEFVTDVEESVLSIFRFLGIPLPDRIATAAPRMKRQSNGVSEEWVARYLTLKTMELCP